MSLDGHLTAAAFVPQGDWGQRLLNAFTERFEALGGIVIAREVFPPDGNDYAGPIRRAFALTQSENRNRRLRAATKIPVEFEPRRRQDIDAIFLAAAPRQARSLRPQLDFHRAQDLPVYATSHVYAGTPDPRADSDLRRMVFTDIPWLLEPGPSAPLKAAAEASLPTAAQRFPRLLALGVDAFRLLPYLERLATQPQERFEGATGHLSIDDQGRVHRELKWGEFVSGRASLVSIDAAELLGDAPPQ
jgi:outer membrane PBP1 activator LpoA protein